jgi:hypothetical protein
MGHIHKDRELDLRKVERGRERFSKREYAAKSGRMDE